MALPEKMDPSPANLLAAGSDLNMLVNTGGRERTEAEYRTLLAAAGFKVARVFPMQDSPAHVIEGLPA
jgi:hypothetical protein